MSALFCLPLDFSIVSANENSTRPADFLRRDAAGLVWRSGNLSNVSLVVQVAGDFDTIAMIGSNLRSNDTIRVRIGATEAGSSTAPVYDSGHLPAWSGVKSEGAGAKSLLYNAELHTARFVRIDITASGHPDLWVQAQRLVIGKRIEHAAIDQDSELGWIDLSPSYQGPGYLAFSEYPTLAQWKIKLSWVSDWNFLNVWAPFLQKTGITQPFLFIPVVENAARFQTEMVFGNMVSSVQPRHPGFDLWALEMTIRALAP